MNNIIEIDHLSKRFGEVQAVQDLSFRVKEGELFAFLGINGAGKSTTINIMCGQLPKDAGRVQIGGVDLDTDRDSIKRSLGVVFQSSVLDKDLSVRDNLESRAALYGIHGKAFQKRLEELARQLAFEDLFRRHTDGLGGVGAAEIGFVKIVKAFPAGKPRLLHQSNGVCFRCHNITAQYYTTKRTLLQEGIML